MANGMTRQYIGARYVPIFADPVQWDDERTYEPLMMVQYSGETYMSKQYVPANIPLPSVATGEESNDYWVHMSNWNAQVEGYREEVLRYAAEVLLFDGRITATEQALPIADFDSTNTVSAAISAINTAIDAITANDWVTTARIADANVTTAKIADSAVTTAKIDDASVTTAKISDSAVTTAKIADSVVTSAKIADGSIVPADLAKHSMIVIGDSYSNGADEWPTYVANALNLTLYNYAEDSAGWSALGYLNHTFADNMQQAVNDLTAAQRALVDYVIVYGGINDIGRGQAGEGETVADVIAGCQRFKQYCTKANFPNAKFVIACINADSVYWVYRPNFSQLQTAIWNQFEANGDFAVVSSVDKWLIGFPKSWMYIDDDIHPNDGGQKRIACNMLSQLVGGSIAPKNQIYSLSKASTAPATVSAVSVRLIVNEQFFYLQGAVTFSGFTGGIVDVADMPADTYVMAGYTRPGQTANPVVIPRFRAEGISVTGQGETQDPFFYIYDNKLKFSCPTLSSALSNVDIEYKLYEYPLRVEVG